jgi:hypothetical protein
MEKRTRGRVLLAIGTSLGALLSGLFVVGSQRADQALDEVRARAAVTQVSASDFLATMYGSESPIVRRLEVDPTGVEMVQSGPNTWCLRVTVRRLLAARTAAFTFQLGSVLTPAPSC